MEMQAEWIAVDWGTSRLRAWAMEGDRVVAEAHSDKGMSHLETDEFEATLLTLIEGWLGSTPMDVIACGMVGARQGWAEAPYSAIPAPPLPKAPVRVINTGARLRVSIVPGLKQIKPADVMRGEETQIAGFLARNENWDGVVCLPGTHTKWAHVSANEVVSFQTFMTGELFELLATSSVLRHSVQDGWDNAAFVEGMHAVLSRPETLASKLFGIRAGDLLEGSGGAAARANLSGILIGAELGAARPYWLGQRVAIIGAKTITHIYADALKSQGVPVSVEDGRDMTVSGLVAARNLMEAFA